jgi:hypothetical protein
MMVATIIRRELAKRQFTNLKDAAAFLGVSTELLRMLVNKGRLPKDRLLIRIADRLGLDRVALVLTAHKQKVPRDMHGFFLEPKHPVGGTWEQKRKWPLSQEQCEYLSRIMNEQEIQLVRKYRQLDGDQRSQALGYIDYHFQRARQEVQTNGRVAGVSAGELALPEPDGADAKTDAPVSAPPVAPVSDPLETLSV